MKNNPFLKTIVTTIPFAVSLFLPNNTYFIWRILLLVIFLGLDYYINVSSNSTIIMERSQNKLATQMLHAAKEIAEYRENDIKESFAKVINGVGVYEKLNYNPEKKLDFILEQLRTTFKNYIVIEDENISTAIFYHFGFQEERKWTRLGQNYFSAYEDDESVIFDSNSFGNHVLNNKKRFHFLNDKLQEGVKEGIYKLNDKDVETEKECHKYGSIIGLRFCVKDESKKKEDILVLLTISTYGKQIDNVPFKAFRKRIEREIRKDILPMFQKEIESELMQLYLQEMG